MRSTFPAHVYIGICTIHRRARFFCG